MEKQNNQGSSFLIGLLIGGAVGALVSTKKGRQILKDLSVYGLEYVGRAINFDDVETILNEDEEEMMGGEVSSENEGVETDEKKEEPSRRKRLFRGIRKK